MTSSDWTVIPTPRRANEVVTANACAIGSGRPADMNSHLGLVSRMSARSGRRCSRRPSWCSSLCTPAPAPAEPAGSAGREAGLCGTSCFSRTAQVMRPFDLSPSSDHPAEVPERSTAGQQEADGTGAAQPNWKHVYPCGSWHSEAHAQTTQARPAVRRGQSNAVPRHPQGSRDCPWIPWAMRGPDPRSSVIFWEPGGLFTAASGPSKSWSKRCGKPLAPPRFRPRSAICP